MRLLHFIPTFIMLLLNLLINTIVQSYFKNSTCILHYYDYLSDPVHIESIPTIKRKIRGTDNLLLDQTRRCKHFLLHCEDASLAFESTEYVIKKRDGGMYNDRKYIIIVNNAKALEIFFQSFYLTFVRDVLVIYGFHNNTTDPFIFQTNSSDTIINYHLYTHKYVGLEGINERVLLDIWYPENMSFKFGNNLFPDKISNQQGRELKTICYTTLPYAICGHSEFCFNSIFKCLNNFSFKNLQLVTSITL